MELESVIYQLGWDKSLGAFVHSLVGIDQEAAKRTFGNFLEESRLNENAGITA